MQRITVTFSDLTAAEAANLFAAIRHDYDGPAPVAAPAPVQEAPAKAAEADPPKPAARKGRKAKDAPAPAQEAPAASAADPVATVPTTSLDDLRKGLSDLLAAEGMTVCSQVLQAHGATRISELPEGLYGAVLADAKAAMA